MTQQNLLQLAKQGDARAITSLLNRSLQTKGITAKAAQRDGVLHVLLEGQVPPNQPASVRCIYQGLQKLGCVDIPVIVYGRQQGNAEVSWQSQLDAPLVGDASELKVAETSPPAQQELAERRSAPPAPSIIQSPEAPSEAHVQGNGMPQGDGMGEEEQGGDSSSWEEFDFRSAGNDEPTALTEDAHSGYASAASSWDDSLVEDDFALDSPDEPTLIVPPQPDEELDAGISDEDSDSEILLSLWDDADIDEDDMVEASQDGNGEELDLWQDGGSGDSMAGDVDLLNDSPGLIGEPKSKRKGSALLPILLLALLGMLGGAAAASRLGVMRVPWLANLPVVGPFLTPAEQDGVQLPPSQVSQDAEPSTPSDSTVPSDSAVANKVDSGEGSVDTNAEDGTASSTTPTVESTTAPTEVAADPFREAVNSATSAATLAQIATSSEDWGIVAEHWSDAVSGMKNTPEGHSRYQEAQNKISEYQKNLDYARRLANP